jgi:hypothetical protein
MMNNTFIRNVIHEEASLFVLGEFYPRQIF